MGDALTLTVLGCSGSYAGPGDACSGYLVRAGDTAVVLDLGPGTFANLQAHVDPAEVDGLVLTHEHPDHWVDLPILRNAFRYVLGIEGLDVYGTEGTRALATALIDELPPTLVWHTAAPGETLAVVRDQESWSRLVPLTQESDGVERFGIFSFHFADQVDNSGFVGWLATHLKAELGTGVFVVCGSNRARGGIYDYWGCPIDLLDRAVAVVRALRAS